MFHLQWKWEMGIQRDNKKTSQMRFSPHSFCYFIKNAIKICLTIILGIVIKVYFCLLLFTTHSYTVDLFSGDIRLWALASGLLMTWFCAAYSYLSIMVVQWLASQQELFWFQICMGGSLHVLSVSVRLLPTSRKCVGDSKYAAGVNVCESEWLPLSLSLC